MVAEQDDMRIRDRGRSGQCRESNHTQVCESWDPTKPHSKPKFINEERRIAAVFYGAIMDWAASKGKGLDFWLSGENTRSTIILRAIRAIWGKETCQMNVQFDSEKSLGDNFPILMWAEMFRTSPQFAHLYGPKEIVLAIELCLQGDPSPWKNARLAIEDMNRHLPLADRPHQVKGSKKRSKPDTRSEFTTWSETSPWQDWSASGGTWAGWTSFPSPNSRPGWRDDQGTGASSQDTPSGVSESQSESGRGGWEAEDYGQSRSRSTVSSQGWTTSVIPPWKTQSKWK